MPSQPKTCAPLEGIRVLDLTRAVTGPFCTMLLGDLGARIIKIEEPGTGDETRQWGPPFVEGESAYFLALNRNKESVALDFKQECDLAGAAPAGVGERRGGAEFSARRRGTAGRRLRKPQGRKSGSDLRLHFRLRIEGPDCQRPGYDLIVQAMSA
jgi:crotonobetainyl-CoA:carnitine CoA-transferase CaiB-like acyl-CoA transferase